MQVKNEKILDRFRAARRCEWCKKPTTRCHPHHLWARGMGGGGRIDLPINLIALCAICHHDVHLGLIQKCDLLAVVATREKTDQDSIKAEITRLRRC